MEILAALKAGEVAITEAGKVAYGAGLRWNEWRLGQALTAGYIEETETAATNREEREAEFRRIVEA